MTKEKAWVISINMGYGHQRTAYPLKGLAPDGEIIQSNDYAGIPERDRKIWEGARKFYEAVSRFKRIPLIGGFVFIIFNEFQKIFTFYPKRNLSKPSFQLRQNFLLIKGGWGKDLILKLSPRETEKALPIISTFFTPAFIAEHFGYPGEIFCVVCDADIARTWAPLEPQKSKIKYFAPNNRVVERLKLYGVKRENIFLTGYPLPLENTGDEDLKILKSDLKYRLLNLDPQKRFSHSYSSLIEEYLGELPQNADHPLTIMFSVGGAGAQKEIGVKVIQSMIQEIKDGKIKIILSAGIKEEVKQYFEENTRGLDIQIIFEKKIENYFQKFNEALRKTDILWTKPSELSFYSALGLPIIIAPPIGSQEEFNKRWLLKSGFGLSQEDPNHVHQWLFDWLNNGYLAEAAMQGFVEGEKLGTLKIKKICRG